MKKLSEKKRAQCASGIVTSGCGSLSGLRSPKRRGKSRCGALKSKKARAACRRAGGGYLSRRAKGR